MKKYKRKIIGILISGPFIFAIGAVVGTLIGGSTGAIIGGATAKKVTSGYSSDGGIGYNYTVFINVKDLSNPLIKIKLYSNADKANEITALINAVIEFNRR